MPSNSKKKKAGKKKNQKKQSSPKDPNPNSQGNGKEDETEETFMTPRSQLDHVDLTSGIVEIEGSNVVESSNCEEEKSKEMKLEESVVVSEISNGLDVGINLNSDESAKGKKLKEILPEIGGESQKDDEVSKEMKLDEFVQSVEKSVHVDVEMTPKASIEVGISSLSSTEKEVPLTTEEINVHEDADDNVEVVHLENGSGVDGDTSMEREFQKDGVLKEEKLGAQHMPVIHKSREEIRSFQQGLPQVDENTNYKTVEKSIDDSSIPVENSVIAIEEPSQGRKVYNESVISASDDSFHGKNNIDADKTEIAHQNEVARGTLVVCHATPWNCCGLLEFLRSSDR